MIPESTSLIRLYLDEDVHKRVAVALRLRNFDAVSTHEVGGWGRSDEDQLAFAATQGRAIFTFNTPDFLRLHMDWLRGNREHSGIIVSDQIAIGETVRRLLNLLNRVTADEMRNQLRWLQGFK
jgi:Domain of unknown function (DUF5615)